MRLQVILLSVALIAQVAHCGTITDLKLSTLKACSGTAEECADGHALTCTGSSYCYPGHILKPGPHDAECPAGYTLDKNLNKCAKQTGAECPALKGSLSKDDKVCTKCAAGSKYDERSNSCIVPCKAGYDESVPLAGTVYCVDKCLKNYAAVGVECVKLQELKVPKKCEAKLCPVGSKIYFSNDSDSVVDTYNPPKDTKNATAAYLDMFPKKGKADECVCAFAKKRGFYTKAGAKAPEVTEAMKMYDFKPATCNGDSMPLAGMCKGECPKGAKPDVLGCQLGCPSGFKTCYSLFGKEYCATKSDLFGLDSCKVLAALEKDLDTAATCKYP